MPRDSNPLIATVTDAPGAKPTLLEKIATKIDDLAHLKILTVVGELDAGGAPIDPQQVKVMCTKIDLIDGDIVTATDPAFIDGPYQQMMAVHKEREAEGGEIIRKNIEALQALIKLARDFGRKDGP